MKTIIRSMRLYLWPILALNAAAMAAAVGGNALRSVLFSIVISLLASFGFLLNDLWDLDVDRVNRPRRFENSDELTIALAVAASIGCLIFGFGLAFWLGAIETGIAYFLALGLAAYSVVLRRYLIIPTVLAGVLAASPLWSPLILWPRNVRPIHWAFIAAMVLLFAGREILMDVRDRKGDAVGARATIATVFGARIAKSAAVVLLAGGAVLLTSVQIARSVNSPVRSLVPVSFALSMILCLVLFPAYRAFRLRSEQGEDQAAIQKFVLRSRTAMALLPLLIFLMWGN